MTSNEGPATPAGKRTGARAARAAKAPARPRPTTPRARKPTALSTAAPQAPQPLPVAAEPATTPERAAGRTVSRAPRVRQACRLTPAEYARLGALKKRAAALARPTKRGGLLRAGLYALCGMDDAQLFALLDSLPDPDAATA